MAKTKKAEAQSLQLKSKLVPDFPIADLKEYANNTKVHSEADTERLSKVIRANGFTDPILINKEGVIIAGHGRRLAMLKLGATTIPAFVVDHLTPAQERALRIGHNKGTAIKYDIEKMAIEIAELQLDDDFDFDALGLVEAEINLYSGESNEMDASVFTNDIGEDIEAQNAETTENIERTDAKEVQLWKAVGFRAIPKTAEKMLIAFMARIETETGKKGADAFVEFVGGVMA